MSDGNNYVGEGDNIGLSSIFGWSDEEKKEVVQGIIKGENTVLKGPAYFNPNNPNDPDINDLVELPKI